MKIKCITSITRMRPHFSFFYVTPLVCFQRFDGRFNGGSILTFAWMFFQIEFMFKKGGLK